MVIVYLKVFYFSFINFLVALVVTAANASPFNKNKYSSLTFKNLINGELRYLNIS